MSVARNTTGRQATRDAARGRVNAGKIQKAQPDKWLFGKGKPDHMKLDQLKVGTWLSSGQPTQSLTGGSSAGATPRVKGPNLRPHRKKHP